MPFRHIRETVAAVVKEEEVEIWLPGICIANHARCREPHTLVRNPTHFQGLFRPIADTQALAPSSPAANPVRRPLSIYAELVEGGRP